MKVYKITYKLFGWLPGLEDEPRYANVRAYDGYHAMDRLRKELKINGHRLDKIIDIELSENQKV